MQLEHILQVHGLIGRGGGKGKDNIPPPPITNFRATIVGETIKLTYSIPDDSDFIGLLIVGNNKGYPTGINDGDVVLNVNIEDGGTIPEEVIDNNITLGVRRYYRAFPYDWDRNYQTDTGQQVSEIIKISQLAPSAPTLKSRTSTSITLNIIEDCEYRIGSNPWQDNPTFTGLSIATNYTFYARRKETGTHYASPSSDGATFATDKGTQSAPSAPTVSEIEHDRATVNGGSGTEVRLGSGSWYDSPHIFTGLSAETSYQAYARMKETNTHYASPSSAGKSFTTAASSPGPSTLIAGDMNAGFFGEVPASELFTASEIASACGISQGTAQFENEPWLKFAIDGKIIYRPRKAIRHSISWNSINTANCVYGGSEGKRVTKNGQTYIVRLMKGALTDPSKYDESDRGAKGSEWNRLMLPIHEQAIDKSWAYPEYVEDNVPVWSHNFGTGANGMYTDADLMTHNSHGNGSYNWCQETRDTDTSRRVTRGRTGVSYSSTNTASYTRADGGWSPVLELVS